MTDQENAWVVELVPCRQGLAIDAPFRSSFMIGDDPNSIVDWNTWVDFTDDRLLRLSRESDANELMRLLPEHIRKDCKATEHMWCADEDRQE